MYKRIIFFIFIFIFIFYFSQIAYSQTILDNNIVIVVYYYNLIKFNKNPYATPMCMGLVKVEYNLKTGATRVLSVSPSSFDCESWDSTVEYVMGRASYYALHGPIISKKTDLIILFNLNTFSMGICKKVDAGGLEISDPRLSSLTIFYEKHNNIPLYISIIFNKDTVKTFYAQAIEWYGGTNPCTRPFPNPVATKLLSISFIIILIMTIRSIRIGREWLASALERVYLVPPDTDEETYPLSPYGEEDYS